MSSEAFLHSKDSKDRFLNMDFWTVSLIQSNPCPTYEVPLRHPILRKYSRTPGQTYRVPPEASENLTNDSSGGFSGRSLRLQNLHRMQTGAAVGLWVMLSVWSGLWGNGPLFLFTALRKHFTIKTLDSYRQPSLQQEENTDFWFSDRSYYKRGHKMTRCCHLLPNYKINWCMRYCSLTVLNTPETHKPGLTRLF